MSEMPTDCSPGFVSVFDRPHDVVVLGSGLIGFAAVRAFFAAGRSVAWLHPGGDILWEISRALENDIGDTQQAKAWKNWLNDHMFARDAVRENWLEGAVAEAAAAREILTWRDRVSVLLHAGPVAVETEDGLMSSITVATKAGARRVRGKRWLDATENGVLVSLCRPNDTPCLPENRTAQLIFQSQVWNSLQEGVEALCRSQPTLAVTEAARTSERRFRFSLGLENGEDFSLRVPGLVRQFRDEVPNGKFVLSHFSGLAYPVYREALTGDMSGLPENLLVASPGWRGGPMVSLADRFESGHAMAAAMWSLPACERSSMMKTVTLPDPASEWESDILVAGAGTAGAVAAVAAARRGANTVALEQAPFAGGIGAGGGISTYFHGKAGGLQEEIDAHTQELTALFGGITAEGSWHHEARKIALAGCFQEAGVRFEGDTILCGAERDAGGRIQAVLAARDGMLTRYRAAAFVDSTGDGDLCALAGVPFSMGRPGDGRTLAYSQVGYYLKENAGGHSIGILNFDAGWVDPTDPEDLTRARLEGLAFHLHDDWPVEDKPFLLAPLLGIRQSRQIETEVRLELDDLIASARFPDAVGEAAAIVDNHSTDFEFESDDMLFYLWVCRGFHLPLRTELPYRMLLPVGLTNVWVACRAAGISADAAYCVRMQRDMQRLGEVAGTAAGLAVENHRGSREVNLNGLRDILRKSGAHSDRGSKSVPPNPEGWLAALDGGRGGLHLWQLAKNPGQREQVAERLADEGDVSFYAAAVLAFQGDPRAESRLLTALQTREAGESAEGLAATGAFGQWVAIPFWLQAVVLLRLCGSDATVPALRELVVSAPPFNVLTMTALTLERLVGRGLTKATALPLWEALAADRHRDQSHLPTTRSLWRELASGSGQDRSVSWGVDTRQDHLWQLHLILTRTATVMRMPEPIWVNSYRRDERAFVRQAFAAIEA